MKINDAGIVSEVRNAFDAYERALMRDDLAAMQDLFWDSAFTVRLGIGENLYGIDAINAFRKARRGSPQRVLTRVNITTFGADFAIAHAEFLREGGARPGRQSQTWVHFPEGWRVVSAHLSLLGEHS